MPLLRVFTDVGPAIERITARVEGVDVVDISGGVPPGVEAEVLFGGWTERSIDALAHGVRWLQLPGTGVDGVPAALLAAPIVTCARGASAVPISEFVLASMLAFEKGFPQHWLHEAPDRWNFQRMDTLAGKRLAIVGLGGIGSRVARLALAFEMEVRAVRRHVDAPNPVTGVDVIAEVDDALPWADHLVLAVPATPRTRRLLDARAFGLVQPGVHLVNIARGSLVDQDALRDALDDGRVARASLDVCAPEPLPAGHWMYTHPRVFLTPHSSWSSRKFLDAAIDAFCENLVRYRSGAPLRGIVDVAEGY